MGVTGVIDRGETVRDRSVEQGMEVEIIASAEQCGSEILFYGIGTLEPGANTASMSTTTSRSHGSCSRAIPTA